MCGISGFYQSCFDYKKNKIWEERLQKMKNSLLHRGPDNNDIYIDSHIGLAHTRLSIIDLSSGHQPMKRTYNERSATIIFNGEIYNYCELKNLMSKKGARFITNSDTEVILMGYLMYGTSFFESLNGIFALAIYDNNFDELIIARDHLGVKPLFYQELNNSFVFASEQKGLFAYGIAPVLNQDSFKEVFGLGPARTPGCGIYSNMKELLPGSFMRISKCHSIMDANFCSTDKCYTTSHHFFWKLTAKENKLDYNEACEYVSFLVRDSVTRQMISDIPICTFLSGGLDSSLVSSICADNLELNSKTLNTYSFDFTENNKNFIANDFQPSLDRPYVDIMKNYINSNHTYLECDTDTQINYLSKAVEARDLPCMADVESSLLYFCSLVSKNIKVALTGECADEIFGGYPWFKYNMSEITNFPWSKDFKSRTAFLKDDIIMRLDLEEYSKSAFETTINNAPVIDSDSESEKNIRKITYLNIQWFMMTLLNRMDRTSMYSGLEARVPFADYRLLQFTYNLPWSYKCHNGISKSLLVETGKSLSLSKKKPLLPESILFRKKSPYPKTYDIRYEKTLKTRLRDILYDKNSPLYDFVDINKVNLFLDTPMDYGKPWYGQLMAGPQLIGYYIQLDYWLRKCHYIL